MGYVRLDGESRMAIFKKLRLIIGVYINKVRDDIAEKYDVKSPDSTFYKYKSLNIEVITKFYELMKRYFEKHKDLGMYLGWNIDLVNSELRHNSQVLSKLWNIEHVFCVITVLGKKIYVDPSSSEFHDIIPDIPDYIISFDKIKYYILDDDNWYYRMKLNIKEYTSIAKVYNFFKGIRARISDYFYNRRNRNK